jgi:hypothetical protein
MTRFSSQLTRLLLVRGFARAITPVAVIWAIYDWYWVKPLYALIFGLLTANYVLVYILTWVAPSLLNGPWRIRPWQTFVLILNAFVLPITFYRHLGRVPWGFVAITLLFFVGLYLATVIHFYLQSRLPMAGIFAARKVAQAAPGNGGLKAGVD